MPAAEGERQVSATEPLEIRRAAFGSGGDQVLVGEGFREDVEKGPVRPENLAVASVEKLEQIEPADSIAIHEHTAAHDVEEHAGAVVGTDRLIPGPLVPISAGDDGSESPGTRSDIAAELRFERLFVGFERVP